MMEHLLVRVVLRMALRIAHASSVTLEKVIVNTAQDVASSKKNTHEVHALLPAVVFTKGQQEVTTVFSETVSEVLGTGLNVVALKASHRVQVKLTTERGQMVHTTSWQFTPGAHLSLVNCMRPCSPLPPTVWGLQLLSWRAIEAKMMGETGDERLKVNSIHAVASN